MPFDLSDKVAFVTGAGTGIGAATARTLARHGAHVAVAGLPTDPLDAVVAEIRDAGGTAVAVPADVSQAEQVQAAVDAAVARLGPLRLAVNCAGISGVEALLHEDPVDDWRRVLGVNLDGIFHAMRAEIPAMLAGGGGSIVNIASVQATIPIQKRAAYTASKFGVIGLTKTAAIDYVKMNIRVNAVSPGVTDTPMVAAGGATAELASAAVPIGRMARPEDIANAAAFLLSDEASYVTGAELVVDGAYLLK